MTSGQGGVKVVITLKSERNATTLISSSRTREDLVGGTQDAGARSVEFPGDDAGQSATPTTPGGPTGMAANTDEGFGDGGLNGVDTRVNITTDGRSQLISSDRWNHLRYLGQ